MSSLGLRSLRPLFLRHLAYKAAPSIVDNGAIHRLNTMSSFSDLSKPKTEPDGSFKRVPSSFRNFIQVGGQFPPEKGTSYLDSFPKFAPQLLSLQIAIISTCPMRAVRLLVTLCVQTASLTRGSLGHSHAYHAQVEGTGGYHS